MPTHVNRSLLGSNKKISFTDFKNATKDRINFDPRGWGKYAWPFLFAIVFSYPKNPSMEDADECKNLFEALIILLPCLNCRGNYKKHLKQFPLDDDALSNRINLIEWLYNINNAINETLDKPTYSLNETINYYYNILQEEQPKETPKEFTCPTYLIVIIFLGLLIACASYWYTLRVRRNK
jgi:hypothetical protein